MRRVMLLGVLTLLAVSCGIDKNVGTGSAPVALEVIGIQSARGGSATFVWSAGGLLSDVKTGSGWFDDYAQIALRIQEKNPDYAPEKAVDLNDVILESYTVHYFRSDGHAVAGLDVPYDIAGALSGVVVLSSHPTFFAVIEVVRHAAKNEPPLRTLVDGGGEDLIHVVAQITVYGRTVSGVKVSATGNMDITFGDFADPSGTATPTPTSTSTGS
jgi:hypothetical protein